MKVILHVVAILVAGAAAVLTLQHKRKFEELQEVRIRLVADNKTMSANADLKEKELKDGNKEMAAAVQKREELTQSLNAVKSSGLTVRREAAELEDKLKTQQEEFDELNKRLETVSSEIKNLGPDVSLGNLDDRIQETGERQKTGEAKLEELQTLTSAAEKLLATQRAETDRLVKRDIEREARFGRNAAESVVTAVNQDWGFLVIGAGSNSGFTPQTSLLIQRDGRLLARVTPSAVEPTQTIAEIDFDSIAPGVRIQPGDRVLLAKPSAN
jgi:predicted  nucleic acid-binding Zn-ribbon protein